MRWGILALRLLTMGAGCLTTEIMPRAGGQGSPLSHPHRASARVTVALAAKAAYGILIAIVIFRRQTLLRT